MNTASPIALADTEALPTAHEDGRAVPPKSLFIAGPVVDRIAIIYAPLLALAIGIAVAVSPLADMEVRIGAYRNEIADLFIGCFIFAHLFLVFFRSHGNPAIFKQYPVRFVAVPVVLFVAMLVSQWIAVAVAVVAIVWDVYHSCMQTFGIGRIYDAKAGNDPNLGRRLDLGVNLLLYAGPILAGATLMMHVDKIEQSAGESVFFTAVPAFAMHHQRILTWLILGAGIPYLTWYVYSYWRMSRQGYRVSFEKVSLLASTGYCSIYVWGFNSFAQAFFIMNFFHALQYFVIVWKTEGRNLQSRAGLGGFRWGRAATFLAFLAVAVAFGLWAETTPSGSDVTFAIIMVVAILHFWYDGFIWSVRKKQV